MNILLRCFALLLLALAASSASAQKPNILVI